MGKNDLNPLLGSGAMNPAALMPLNSFGGDSTAQGINAAQQQQS